MKHLRPWRLALVMLATVLALTMWLPSAQAAETESVSPVFTRVNPLYGNGAVPAMSEEMEVAEEIPVYPAEDVKSAAQALRDIFKNREATAILKMPKAVLDELCDGWESMDEALYQTLMAHTGKGNEGDYIERTYGGYSWSARWSTENDVRMVSITFYAAYYTTAEQEAELTAYLKQLYSAWNLDDATDYEKVCAVYDWLCENVTYYWDYENGPYEIYSAYGAVINRECVCQGYAVAAYRMLLDLGVDCRIITGIGNGGGHAWNIIELDGLYYNADATWDAIWHQAGLDYEWYLTCDANFYDHYRDEAFMTAQFYAEYPMSPEDYRPIVEDPVTSGTCGETATWNFADGVLTISGTGAMYDYQENNTPWQEYMKEITAIVIEDGITSIGDYAFYNYKKYMSIAVPNSVAAIGNNAFQCDSSVPETHVEFSGDAPSLEQYSFGVNPCYVDYPYSNSTWTQELKDSCDSLIIWRPYDDRDLYIDMGGAGEDLIWILDQDYTLTLIGTGAMEAFYAADMPWWRYYNVIEAVNLPEGLTTISHCAFCGHKGIKNITIPSTVVSIGVESFTSCTGLTSISIPESVTVIEFAFEDCTSLAEITFEGDAPAIDNYAFHNVVATVYYPLNNDTWTEDVLQQYGGTFTWKGYKQPGEVIASGTSVSLVDGLDMHFFFSGDGMEDATGALVTRYDGYGQVIDTQLIDKSQWDILDGMYYVTYRGIDAKEMGDMVSVTILDDMGEAISETYTDSIQAYAMRMLEKESDPELLTLLVDMLNYGAQAQTYFGYMEESLVNADLTETQRSYASIAYEVENLLEAGAGRAATALSLKNRITLDLFFDSSVMDAAYSAVVKYTDHNGQVCTMLIWPQEFKEAKGNRICVSVPGLAIADYGQAVTCTVYDAEGNAIAWVTDSIGGYVARMEENIPEIVSAIAKFGNAAYNYFHD